MLRDDFSERINRVIRGFAVLIAFPLQQWLHESASMLCSEVQCLSCVPFIHKVSETPYLSVTKSILSNRSKWARPFAALHLTTSKTIHTLTLYSKAGSQNSCLTNMSPVDTCHVVRTLGLYKYWSLVRFLSAYLYMVHNRGFTNFWPGVMSRCVISPRLI